MFRVTKKIIKILTVRQRYLSVFIAILMFIGGLLESISVSLILPLISAIMDKDGWNTKWYAQVICDLFQIETQRTYISVLLVILIFMFIFKNMFLLFEYYVQYSFMARSSFQMRKQLMHAFLNKPYGYYLGASNGEILRIIVGDTSQAFSILTCLMGFYTETIVGVILAITIIVMSWQIALGTIVILLVEMFVITCAIKPVMKRMGNQMRKEGALSNKWLLHSINGIKSIKVANKESFFENKYIKHERIVVDISRKNQTIQNLPRLIIESFTIAGVLGMLLIFVETGMDVASLVPQLSAFMVAAVRLLPSVNRITGYMNGIPFQEGGLDNVIHTLNTEDLSYKHSVELDKMDNEEKEQIIQNMSFKDRIQFKDISFSYDDNSSKIFDHANFEILKGQSIGLVGTSGAGKTTAVDIILGLLKPTSGQVLVDNVNIEENLPGWLFSLAYIPQSIFLMDDTIGANVAFGTESNERTEEQIWKALREAQMEDFVRSLPEGIDTIVGEQGIRLSGGQRQRIGIARALYNEPDILFFDEATSALDNETEAAIMESINYLKGKRTLVIIAHRLTTIENCDVVFRVADGKVMKER